MKNRLQKLILYLCKILSEFIPRKNGFETVERKFMNLLIIQPRLSYHFEGGELIHFDFIQALVRDRSYVLKNQVF